MPEETWSQTSPGGLPAEACTEDHQVPAVAEGKGRGAANECESDTLSLHVESPKSMQEIQEKLGKRKSINSVSRIFEVLIYKRCYG